MQNQNFSGKPVAGWSRKSKTEDGAEGISPVRNQLSVPVPAAGFTHQTRADPSAVCEHADSQNECRSTAAMPSIGRAPRDRQALKR